MKKDEPEWVKILREHLPELREKMKETTQSKYPFKETADLIIHTPTSETKKPSKPKLPKRIYVEVGGIGLTKSGQLVLVRMGAILKRKEEEKK